MVGRALRGEHLRSPIPHGHWKTTTFVAALRNSGMVAPMVLDGPINGAAFQAYIDQVLVPEIRPGDIVIMDNLGSHIRRLRHGQQRVADCAREAGVSLA
jgi:transposase